MAIERAPLLQELHTCSEEVFHHVAVVLNDTSKRMKHDESFKALGRAARVSLATHEPEEEESKPVAAEPSANDVTVAITGVQASVEQGHVG